MIKRIACSSLVIKFSAEVPDQAEISDVKGNLLLCIKNLPTTLERSPTVTRTPLIIPLFALTPVPSESFATSAWKQGIIQVKYKISVK